MGSKKAGFKRLKTITEGLKAAKEEGAVPGEVVEIIGRTGVRGEAIQVLVKVEGPEGRVRTIRRNVRGPVRVGDIIILRDPEIEAAPLTRRRR